MSEESAADVHGASRIRTLRYPHCGGVYQMGDDQVNDPKLNGKNVKVQGKYFPNTGAILVSSIEAAK